MAAGGITSVICTTHYMKGRYEFTKESYRLKLNELETEVKHHNIPIKLYPGAEVYLTNSIAEDIKKHDLTLAGSNYVLIETNLNGFPADFHKNVYDLLRNGYKPILAHAERYVSIMNKTHEAKELINRNIYLQVNAASVIGGYGNKVKDTAWKMLNKGWMHLLGSDHHAKSDYTAFFRAKEKIIEHIDEKTAAILTEIDRWMFQCICCIQIKKNSR